MYVLYVDDDEALAQGVEMALRDKGHVCEVAELGKQALTLSKENSYDIVVLDVGLPDTDGFSLCRELCTDPAAGGVPVVFLTARNTGEDERQGLDSGAVDFISKPTPPDILRLRVRNHL